MLASASSNKSVVLVDEVEDGLYYKHKAALWRGILELARHNDTQMFLTTHDEEWLEALTAAPSEEMEDIALWRFERLESGHRVLRQFTGRSFKAALEFGGELRGP